jgi:oligoribonuclease
MSTPKYLAWIDLETTGSDRVEDPIIEFAMIVTNPSAPFDEVTRLQSVVRPEGQQWSHRMNATVLEMHVSNGLLADVFGNSATPLAKVDSLAAECLHGLAKPHEFLIAGSGVSHFDRGFIAEQMPKLNRFLAYAAIDVGVLRRTLAAIGLTVERETPEKTHRAMDDIEDHLTELRHYATILRVPELSAVS